MIKNSIKIRKSIKERIKEHFFKDPNIRLRVRQIEREVDVPLPSAIKYAKELENEGILIREIIGNVTFYTTDYNSPKYRIEKTLHNIRSLHECGLIEHIKEECFNPTIILFGSYSRGEDIISSDIDIFVETKTKIGKTIKKFEKKLHREVQLFEHKSIRDIKNKHLINNILNGLTLSGQIEVFK